MYEKCVYFIFLVILAIISCSGFRIDSLAMTNVNSRRNFDHTSTSSLITNSDSILLNRIFNINNNEREYNVDTNINPSTLSSLPNYRHQIRHHRHLRAQAHSSRHFDSHEPPSGHIDAFIIPPKEDSSPTIQPSERFAQIPSTIDDIQHPLYPTRSIITRSQRSSQKNHHHAAPGQKRKQHHCQEPDFTTKAYLAKIVVVAIAESTQKRKTNYTVVFKVIREFKNSSLPVDQVFQLTFGLKNYTENCNYNESLTGSPLKLVKGYIRKTKQYILFLNPNSEHNYTAFGAPELYKTKMNNVLLKVVNPNFKPKKPEVEILKVNTTSTNRTKLVCKTRGLPIPQIIWKRNNEDLPNNKLINYKNEDKDRRKSTLVIKNIHNGGGARYECIAQGVDNSTDSKTLDIGDNKCDDSHEKNFCQNGGKCYFEQTMKEYYCQCSAGFNGLRCQDKISAQSMLKDRRRRRKIKL